MRLSSRSVFANVSIVEDSSARPVRLSFSGITFRLDASEAIELAIKLADTVTEIQNRKDTP